MLNEEKYLYAQRRNNINVNKASSTDLFTFQEAVTKILMRHIKSHFIKYIIIKKKKKCCGISFNKYNSKFSRLKI